MSNSRCIPETGRRFGSLVVLSESDVRTKAQTWHWKTHCDCGREHWVAASNLFSGHTTSCGCQKRALIGAANRVHGLTRTATHRSWLSMRQRCLNPNCKAYDRYGGRGISICDRWKDSFENFIADMGLRPLGSSLERRDNAKGYDPDNCRWATPVEQVRNRRSTVFVEFDGRRIPLAEAAERTGISLKVLSRRRRLGWDHGWLFIPLAPLFKAQPRKHAEVRRP